MYIFISLCKYINVKYPGISMGESVSDFFLELGPKREKTCPEKNVEMPTK